MSEQKNQQKQPPKRATSGIFAILMALLLLILGQQGILPLGDTADAPDALPTATIAAALTDTPMQLCALWKPSAPFFPQIKKGDLFPAESISRKRSLFLFPVYFPDGCISVNVW